MQDAYESMQNEYESGEGTFVDGDQVYSSLCGLVQTKQAKVFCHLYHATVYP